MHLSVVRRLRVQPLQVQQHSLVEIDQGHSLPSADSRRVQIVIVWQKNVHNTD